jgi:hypothetical protein
LSKIKDLKQQKENITVLEKDFIILDRYLLRDV